MKHEKKLEYITTIAKKILLFCILFIITLLLLEIPQKLFEASDAKILKESAKSVYELKAVGNDMLLFGEKLKMFVDSKPIKKVIWSDKFEADEIILEEVALADEIDILLDGMCKVTTDKLRDGKMVSNGFAAEVRCEIEGIEYTWEIGMLNFEIEDFAYYGSAIYDFDSKKIFYLEMSDGDMGEGDMYWEGTNLRMESVMEYYEGLDVQWAETTVRFYPNVIIFPAYFPAFENNALYRELITAYEKLFVGTVRQEGTFREQRISD